MRPLGIVGLLLLAACTGAATPTTTSEIPAPTTTIADLSGPLADAEARITELEATVDDLESVLADVTQQRTEARDRAADLDRERNTLQAEVNDQAATIEELLLRYDDEIQRTLATGTVEVTARSCSEVDGTESASRLQRIIDTAVGEWVNRAGLPDTAVNYLDIPTITRGVEDCFNTAAEARRQEQLRQPKGDGFWTVGEEIAAGTWESQGSGSSCYWARLDSDQDILDNHFGSAGGRVTIRSSDTEVEFSGCGTWEYQN